MASIIVNNSIGYNLGPETAVREYKTFALRFEYLSYDEIKKIIKSKSFNSVMDQYIKSNIDSYIQYYLGKYAASMSRTIGNNYASLYIGVSDNGTITGIPFKGILTANDIKEIANKYIQTNIRGVCNGIESLATKDKYIQEIQFNVHKLHLSSSVKAHYNNSISSLLKKVHIEEKNIRRTMRLHIRKTTKWMNILKKYDVKLEVISNDRILRKELLKYCIEGKAPISIITRLRSNEQIRIPLGVGSRKTDRNEFDYWVTSFKELMMEQTLSNRPKKSSLFDEKMKNSLFISFHCLSPLIGWWDEDISYYLIEIVLPLNKNPNEWLEYKDNEKWISYVRCENSNNPCCMRM